MDTIREIVNVLLLRGNIGREGAGPCPIRGHSNVQGNRTCGIDHRPAEAWLARLDAACGITSPRAHGLDTVQTIKAMHRGDVKVFLGMGGNFALATPDTALHVRGAPPLRADRPCQHEAQSQPPGARPGGADPAVPGAHGKRRPAFGPAAGHRRGLDEHGPPVRGHERARLAAAALGTGHHRRDRPATLPESNTPWEEYVADYDRIRDKMADAIEGFEDCNRRVRQPLGFRLQAAGPRTGVPDRHGPRELLRAPRCPTSSRRPAGWC